MNHDPRQHPEWLQRDADLHRPLCPAERRHRAALVWCTTGVLVGLLIALAAVEVGGCG